MNDQEVVDRFAVLAKLRLVSLFRLKSVLHFYDPTPGALHSKVIGHGQELTLDKLKRAAQPYRDINRFTSDDRVMQYIIDPGLLPLVTALSKDIQGRKFLVTRKLAVRDSERGVSANVDGYGIRIKTYLSEATAETIVLWECLYGVA